MSLAIFDLDNTLLGDDSDYLWGQFLIEQGLVDGEDYERENQRFYDAYRAGTLDIQEFLTFMLRPLAEHPLENLLAWRARFIEDKIRPILLPKALELLARHRNAGDTLLIITATNRFITAPIAELLDVPHLLATEVEFADGRYTGRSFGIPCFQHGKVERLSEWLAETGHDLDRSWFYSDSHNDLPLLGRVRYPVAVDPDAVLAQHAQERGWPILSLREDGA
ncbi:MAG: HAD family hydrolase [Candidatus Competibacteraceae bacterium]|nr:HAD family hydrolase [Candidatus Competibacteraceae bacterium]